jgi:bifunctional UDP-N-acetylglucosamine pyrophosphorylase/glucosamine-1-phosphate N-acetyltransferase
MAEEETKASTTVRQLRDATKPNREKILNPQSLALYGGITGQAPILVILAAGKGTRFGQDPKCIQLVHGVPLARHSIDAFRRFSPSPVICIVGYRPNEVSTALGSDNIYVRSDDPTGGTAFAAFEAFSVPELLAQDPLVVITMGDRIVPSSVFRALWETHQAGAREAELTFVTAIYEPPKNRGKGRVLRGENQQVLRIIEEKDIYAVENGLTRQVLLNLTEGNCPLYMARAATFHKYLKDLTNANTQGQYYLTDIVEAISGSGGELRTTTTRVGDPEYDLLCSDVTRPMDLALLEGILDSARGLLFPEELEVEEAARTIAAGRPPGQVASIARQLGELMAAASREKLAFEPHRPLGIGISGGRLRIAFMHPDMVRFYGPAWQMPIGAGGTSGEEQIIVMAQGASDRRIHLYPINPKYRESVNFVPSDDEVMYPGEDILDLHTYEGFGTHMSETLLLSLGYFSDEELERRRKKSQPVPPPSLWVANNMRRPFALVGNAIASMRTLRSGNLGAKVQQYLGRQNFRGLRLVSTGNVPQGGFSSSSAVTVATKNAVNALFDLGIPPDLLVHLACQAEYGTGVRAGSLDQATEQKGRMAQGTLISSNPRDSYRVLGTHPVPTDRFQIIFPYSVERDRSAWRWSWGSYAEAVAPSGPLTTAETRKMTGKAAEIAAILTRLPLQTDFFKVIEEDLVSDGLLSPESRAWVCSVLREIPLLARWEELRQLAHANLSWYAGQLMEVDRLDSAAASQMADATLASLFAGGRDPLLRRTTSAGTAVEEEGVPLRAMMAYLFGEVAKNFYLIYHPDQWIEYVTRSQGGDRCVHIDPDRLPSREMLEGELEWERGSVGPERLNLWLVRLGATPVDYNRGLDDESLSADPPPEFHRLEGSNFFRGLALIDLAEAMLQRSFGRDAVAVRVNAAGQGDYFQVHVDTHKASPSDVKGFLRSAFYRRFGLSPEPEFVELHPGGGAVGVRLSRYDALPQLIQLLHL